MEKPTIAVLLGGPSAEREISLKSGRAVAAALRNRDYLVHEIDPAHPGWTLPPDTDVAFIALHGTYGEDGGVQTDLEKMGVPYTGCAVEASQLAFDKVRTKELVTAAGLPTPRFHLFKAIPSDWPSSWNPPVVLKPVRQGSSVGLEILRERNGLKEAVEKAFQFDREVLMEEFIHGREVTSGILDTTALPLVEVRPKQGIYDYRNKYTPGATEYFCPAPFPFEITKKVHGIALAAFAAIGGRDYARVDFMVPADGPPTLLEINTLPGMTETSLFPKAAAQAGLNYEDLCERMIELALRRSCAARS